MRKEYKLIKRLKKLKRDDELLVGNSVSKKDTCHIKNELYYAEIFS